MQSYRFGFTHTHNVDALEVERLPKSGPLGRAIAIASQFRGGVSVDLFDAAGFKRGSVWFDDDTRAPRWTTDA